MRTALYVATAVAVAAAAAGALPTGLSGLGVGAGGYFGDIDQGFVQGEFDFSIPAYLSVGPEFYLGFGNDATTIMGGAEMRVYFIPNINFIIQPHAAFGGGYAHAFTEGDDVNGGYLHFGGGMDFEVPRAPITPYFDMGALILISDDTATDFMIEGGARFDVW